MNLLFQKGEKFLLVYLRLSGTGQDERAVLAEGTAEVAAAQKHGAGHLAGIVQQRQFL